MSDSESFNGRGKCMNARQSWKLGERLVQYPILQGGMGIGISLGGLAGAVAKAGGVGMISAAQIGFREPDFDSNTLEANLRAMEKEYKKARTIAPNGVIGFNIMVAMNHYEAYVKKAVELGADLIVSGAGLPTELPEWAKGENKTMLAPIVSTEKAAKVIMKYWWKKHHVVPDLLIIEGPLAGGHLGFSETQLRSLKQEAYGNEIQKILNVVKEYEKVSGCRIMTAVGGGIDTKEKADYIFELGVDAIQVATRFVTTKECDAHQRYKEAYLKAEKEDIVLVKSPVGMPGRAILNPFIKRVMAGEKIPHGCHSCLHGCEPKQIPYCITDALIRAANGETEEGLLFCGAEAWKSTQIETVKEVIESFF